MIRNNKPPVNTTWPAYLISPCWYNNTEYTDVYEFFGFNKTEALYASFQYSSSDPSVLQEALDSNKGPLNYTYMADKVAADPFKKAVFDSCVVESTPLSQYNLEDFVYKLFDGNVTGQALAQGGSDGVQDPKEVSIFTLCFFSAPSGSQMLLA